MLANSSIILSLNFSLFNKFLNESCDALNSLMLTLFNNSCNDVNVNPLSCNLYILLMRKNNSLMNNLILINIIYLPNSLTNLPIYLSNL